MSPKIEALLIDLKGTLHIEDTAIYGAPDALRRLRASGVKVKFVSNTTEVSLASLHKRLVGLGFDIRKDEIFSALTASVKFIKREKLRPYLIVDPNAMEDFKGIDTNNPNVVVIGQAPTVSDYEHLNKAFRLMKDGAGLIAMLANQYYPNNSGLCIGPGAFVRGLEYATDSTAQIVGKPSKSFFLEASRDLNVEPENTLMVGDDVWDDVNGAMRAGLRGALVKTGKYCIGDEFKPSPSPSFVFENFPAVVDYVLQEQNTSTDYIY